MRFKHFYELACFMTFYIPESSLSTASNVKIKHTYVGGGTSTQTDFKMLEPYIISTDFQVQNPENFNYLYDGHGSINKVMQKIQESGKIHIICNIPLGSISNILTTTQANSKRGAYSVMMRVLIMISIYLYSIHKMSNC